MKTRIIAKLDCKPPYVIKPVLFDGVRKIDFPGKLAKEYDDQGVDEVIYLDVVSSLYNKPIDYLTINSFAKEKFIPLAIGGGIKTKKDVDELFSNGADKIVINTHSLNSPKFIDGIAKTYGKQSIIVHIEAKKINNKYYCFTECGRNNSMIEVSERINYLNDTGAGEILLQSIDFDGLMRGYDRDLFEIGMKYSKIPTILSSGFSSTENILKAIKEFKPSGISISSLLHYKKIKINEIKSKYDWDS